MSRTVYLHIGLAKSGTTYVQHLLQANRTLLETNGVLFPGPKMSEHFMAALDLTESRFKGHTYPEAEGAWARMAATANAFPGATLISHELFAPASGRLIDRLLTTLDTDDVRVVVTARDLARQVPAVWQERVKNGSEERYDEYLDTILGPEPVRGPVVRNRGRFWRQQDLVAITQRWAERLGADRLTVVTLPPSGADPLELWRRFAVAADLPDVDYSFEVGGRNQSLGVVECELLRRLNEKLPELPWPQYAKRVKRRFAEGSLAAGSDSARLVVPRSRHEEVSTIAVATALHLSRLGCRVVGDLADLRPGFVDAEVEPLMPEAVATTDLLELALDQLGRHVSRPLPPKQAAPPARGIMSRLTARLRGR